MNSDLFFSSLQQGLILTLITYGVMIPFRLLNFSDLTAEGAYPFGGAISTSLLLANFNPFVSVLTSSLITGFIGIGTGLVYLKLRVNSLLAGIILSTMVYSVNLRIIGKSNITLFDSVSLFSTDDILNNISILFIVIFIIVVSIKLFLHTQFGLRLRAVGFNQDFAYRQGISITKYTILGLFIASAISGVAGSIIVQLQKYMDIGIGVGIVIHALAALMIGEAIIGNNTINRQILAPFIGATIYQQIQGIALSSGLPPSDLKFFTSMLVLIVIAMKEYGLTYRS